jgi:hypothetical protein
LPIGVVSLKGLHWKPIKTPAVFTSSLTPTSQHGKNLDL